MKVLFRVSIFINILFGCYILIKGSELITKDFLRQDDKIMMQSDHTDTVPIQNITVQENPVQIDEAEVKEEVSAKEETVTCDTIYSILIYDVNAGTQEEKIEEVPLSYVGKNREQLLDLIEDYNHSASLKDLEEGFVSMELVSFSSDKLQVIKRMEKSVYYGCITVEDGYLTVYDEKRKKVILYTDIPLISLPESIQQEIMDGKYVETEAQLYNLLESYSS